MAEFVKVAKKNEIPDDTGKYIEVKGREIALFKVDNKVYAIDHVCPHQGGPLAEGGVNDKVVTCPWHGWEFDVTTGWCTFNEDIKQPTFKVKEEGDDIYVEI
ncbi:MAG TPA: nitrite reductase small subunit NirD [bacterium]|nr:nitrite reductase small subunit NirD [bacterium]